MDKQRGRDTEPDEIEITFERCPNCGGRHVYDLAVERSTSRFYDAPQPRSYVRIFSCPKGGTFQSEITISGYYEEAGDPSLHED
jgi:predicted RNA-binding Zn-ribbon protein involved in translation (DUF1610 family)